MTEAVRNIFRGIGGVLNMWPTTDYFDFVPTETEEERMRAVWEQVGKDIQASMERVERGEGQATQR